MEHESRFTRTKMLVVTGLLLLSFVGIPVHAQESGEQSDGFVRQFKEEAAACEPNRIKYVHKRRGDQLYQSLLQKRAEDREQLRQVCSYLQQISNTAKEVHLPPEVKDRFFWGHAIEMASGFYFELTWTSRGELAVNKEDHTRLVVADPSISESLAGLEFPEQSLTVDTDELEIGKTIRLTGVNISEEATQQVELIWRTTQTDASGLVVAKSFVVHKTETRYGRLDTTFVMPAFGKDETGVLQPILPGEGQFEYSNPYTYSGQKLIPLKPASTPLISINGLPASDPAMKALMIDGRVHVPIRAIATLTKQPVVWDAATKSVLIRTKPQAVEPRHTNQVRLWIDGELADAAYEPVLRDNVTYVPIRTLTAAFNLEVKWWPESRSVNIVIHGA